MSKVDKSIFQSETKSISQLKTRKNFSGVEMTAALLKNSKPSTMCSSKTTYANVIALSIIEVLTF